MKTETKKWSLKDVMDDNKEYFFTPIIDFFTYTIPLKVRNFIWWFKKLFYFLKTGRIKGEYFEICFHMIEVLRFNLPIMIKNLTGCPTYLCEKARKMLKDDKQKNSEYSSKDFELAMTLWKTELGGLLENVLLYYYYSNYGIVDKKDKQMVEIHERYKSTLPYKDESNKELDYKKLHELENKHWNAIWDWMKEQGRSLWD